MQDPSRHRETVLDQFTRQALPFSTAPGIRDEEALALVVRASGAGSDDSVLDVACGPGLVACAFAAVARQVTGIDLTPAMIDRARTLQRERGLANVTWRVGDVLPLPYADASFSIVVSRFAFHHLLEPARVLADMARVCAPGGRVVLVDLVASPDPSKAAAFNRMERLRDPSHVRAMGRAELEGLFPTVGLPAPHALSYRLESELTGVLERSFPGPGDAERVRALFVDSLADDAMGLDVRRDGERLRFAYPVVVLVAERA